MSRAALLNMDDPAFGFYHAMAHRNAFGVMSPLNRFSVLPYFIDPWLGDSGAARKWNLNHQQAHNDALQNLPEYFGATSIGLRIGGNLIDSDLNNPRQRKWFEFQNHQEHYVGGDVILPNVQFPPPAPQWVYPFW